VRVDGVPSNRFLPAPWRPAALALAVALAAAFAVSGCGNTDAAPDPAASSNNVLSTAQLSRYPAGSPQQAFLAYWSALQFQAWPEVASYYDPRLRALVGTASLIGAKKQNTSTFPDLKPAIVSVDTGGDGDKTIHFTLKFADGSTEQTSTTWRLEGGNWQLIYDSRLDGELAQFAQSRAETEQNGAVRTDESQPEPAAATREADVASHLQAEFLQEPKAERP
jgi:hypothetical protein